MLATENCVWKKYLIKTVLTRAGLQGGCPGTLQFGGRSPLYHNRPCPVAVQWRAGLFWHCPLSSKDGDANSESKALSAHPRCPSVEAEAKLLLISLNLLIYLFIYLCFGGSRV
jgi:hypothetical protein